jgi:hypothetical protein
MSALSTVEKNNSYKSLKDFAAHFGLDMCKKLSFADFQKLFLRIIDSYLKQQISGETMYSFILDIDSIPHNPNDESNDQFTVDEIIANIADMSSYQKIISHPVTIDLINKTELMIEDYPHDWPLREALRYYIKYSHLLK